MGPWIDSAPRMRPPMMTCGGCGRLSEMRSTPRLRTVALLCATACSPGDRDPAEPEPEPIARSRYVDLHLDEHIEVCGGQLAAYDRFIDAAFEAWTGSLPHDDFRAEVHVLAEPACSIGRSCARNETAWLFGRHGDFHEIAHIVHWTTDGRSAPSLMEGVASALGNDPFVAEPFQLEEFGLNYWFAEQLTATDYPMASVFTHFLMERFGADVFREYFRKMNMSEHPRPEDFMREFSATFGATIDDVWPEFAGQQRCNFGLWYCDVVELHTAPLEIDGIDCEDGGVMGYSTTNQDLQHDYQPYVLVHVQVEERQEFEIEANSWGGFARCGECAQRLDRLPSSLVLNEGVYAFILPQNPDEPLQFAIRPVEGAG
jgi:hypothetical protein